VADEERLEPLLRLRGWPQRGHRESTTRRAVHVPPRRGRGSSILDVVRTHQFVLARRHGRWDVLETAVLKRAKGELKQINDELERRVAERTSQLTKASEALREAQAELAHVNRVTTMGQLTASISHEVMQPITSGITYAQAALNWLRAQPPKLDEVHRALGRAVEEGNRATDILTRIRGLFKKAPQRKDAVDVNEAILGIVTLTRGEAAKTLFRSRHDSRMACRSFKPIVCRYSK